MRFRKPKIKTMYIGRGIGSIRFTHLDKSSWFKHEIEPLSLDVLTEDGWVPVYESMKCDT